VIQLLLFLILVVLMAISFQIRKLLCGKAVRFNYAVGPVVNKQTKEK
jgi:hypothetical protein